MTDQRFCLPRAQLILSGFGGEDKQLKLMTTVFQNLFPPIHVQTVRRNFSRAL